jgi:biopolymer transport protein ExbD
MSHGGQDESAEGDLTPLLDLVLQLLMFFIVNVNLATEQTNPDVKLPLSASATPLNKPVGGDIYLNQRVRTTRLLDTLPPTERERLANQDSIIFISSKPPMSMLETSAWLREQHDRAEAQGEGKAANVTIHFRPDGELEYNELMKLMTAVKVAGFRKIKMHAIVKPGA